MNYSLRWASLSAPRTHHVHFSPSFFAFCLLAYVLGNLFHFHPLKLICSSEINFSQVHRLSQIALCFQDQSRHIGFVFWVNSSSLSVKAIGKLIWNTLVSLRSQRYWLPCAKLSVLTPSLIDLCFSDSISSLTMLVSIPKCSLWYYRTLLVQVLLAH